MPKREETRGSIISGNEVRATLYQPDGVQYGNSKSFPSDAAAKKWAKEVVAEVLAQVGKRYAKEHGLDGKWELRII